MIIAMIPKIIRGFKGRKFTPHFEIEVKVEIVNDHLNLTITQEDKNPSTMDMDIKTFLEFRLKLKKEYHIRQLGIRKVYQWENKEDRIIHIIKCGLEDIIRKTLSDFKEEYPYIYPDYKEVERYVKVHKEDINLDNLRDYLISLESTEVEE